MRLIDYNRISILFNNVCDNRHLVLSKFLLLDCCVVYLFKCFNLMVIAICYHVCKRSNVFIYLHILHVTIDFLEYSFGFCHCFITIQFNSVYLPIKGPQGATVNCT